MKVLVLLAALSLVGLFSKAQPEKELVLLTVRNDRLELAKAIKFIHTCEPKLICVNVDLANCDDIKHFPLNHFDNADTLAVIRPSESEKTLAREFEAAGSLLLPSEVRPFGSRETNEIIGCGFLYPEGVTTGFVNLIDKQGEANLVEKFQISNTYRKEVSYHFAVHLAFRLNEGATRSFIKSNPNIIPINFDRARKVNTYSMEQFYGNKESGTALKGKIVILSVDRPEEYRQVSMKKRMTASEIFANIACQLVESAK